MFIGVVDQCEAAVGFLDVVWRSGGRKVENCVEIDVICVWEELEHRVFIHGTNNETWMGPSGGRSLKARLYLSQSQPQTGLMRYLNTLDII